MHTDTSCNGESTHASGRCRARENGTLTYSCVKEGVTRSKFCLAPGFVWETSQSYPCWTLTLSRLTAACSRGPQGIATARQDAATTLTSPDHAECCSWTQTKLSSLSLMLQQAYTATRSLQALHARSIL